MNKTYLKFALHGAIATLTLTLVYLTIVTLAQDFQHAVQEFTRIWYLMLPLVLGFGIQVGLFSYVHATMKNAQSATVTTAASTGLSTTSMIACCAHHLVDVLPLLGISAAAAFLSKYQDYLLLLGIASNAIGIILMLRLVNKVRKKHNCKT